MKTCITCKWYQEASPPDRCHSPHHRLNPIDGESMGNFATECREDRRGMQYERQCGPHGRWWEQGEPKKSKLFIVKRRAS